MKRVAFVSAILFAPAALVACAPTDTTDSGTGATGPAYETLSSSAAVTSTLGGVAARYNQSTGNVSVANVAGTLTHNTGATTINDGLYSMTDPDGPDVNGTLTDGTVSIVPMSQPGIAGPAFSGTYDYVTAYQTQYTLAGITYQVNGSYGILTSAVDMPTAGTASYNGEAVGGYVDKTIVAPAVILSNGTSVVNVDFAAGTVDINVSGFTATDGAGNPATVPFNTVLISGMSITGNFFGGGSLEFRDNANLVVDILGPNFSGDAAGNFFGYDAVISAPDETAGGAVLMGDNAYVEFAFIAD